MILDIEPVAARARAAIGEAVRRRGRCIKRRAESPQRHAEPSARPPTRAHERALVLAALEGRRDARRVLVEAFLPSVAATARPYRGLPAASDAELMQAGVVGLLRALERFDPRIGTPFWAYASWWVRRAMQELVAELARPVVLSDRATRDLGRVRRARVHRLQSSGDEPSTPKLAAEAAQVSAVLPVLTARERRVVMARYGVGGPHMTLRDVGDSLSLTAERVRRIERAVLDKFREAIRRGPRLT
jgi:RNA polymerase sigma factor (sigma-70 family)